VVQCSPPAPSPRRDQARFVGQRTLRKGRAGTGWAGTAEVAESTGRSSASTTRGGRVALLRRARGRLCDHGIKLVAKGDAVGALDSFRAELAPSAAQVQPTGLNARPVFNLALLLRGTPSIGLTKRAGVVLVSQQTRRPRKFDDAFVQLTT